MNKYNLHGDGIITHSSCCKLGPHSTRMTLLRVLLHLDNNFFLFVRYILPRSLIVYKDLWLLYPSSLHLPVLCNTFLSHWFCLWAKVLTCRRCEVRTNLELHLLLCGAAAALPAALAAASSVQPYGASVSLEQWNKWWWKNEVWCEKNSAFE